MPRLKRYRCKTGEPPHDEAFACEECGDDVCGYHAEVVREEDGEAWLCPTCAAPIGASHALASTPEGQ